MLGAWPSALYSQWLLTYHSQKIELSLIEAAAAQITNSFTLAGHWGSVIVIKLVLLGLSDEFTGQVKEKFLNIVGLFGGGLQIQHALSLSEVFSPLSENLPLLRQVYFITCKTYNTAFTCQHVKPGENVASYITIRAVGAERMRQKDAEVYMCACMCGTDGSKDSLRAIYFNQK